jgi:adenylosuccinate synthase
MVKRAVIGMQWGDEGKAKVIDYLLRTGEYDVVARYGGGRNAGHSQVDEEGNEIITHLVPAGITKPGIYNMLLAGVMVDPLGLLDEMKEIEEAGYEITPKNLGISNRAHLTFQYHKDFEAESEKKKGRDAIGTTMRAIGPTAVSTYGRESISFEEFLNTSSFEKILKSFSRKHGNIVAKRIPVRQYLKMYEEAIERLEPFRVDEDRVIEEFRDANWLYEGAQGNLLDVYHGTRPYVTASTPHNPPSDTDERVGIVKAYVTRVGNGPFPTQMDEDDEVFIRGCMGETPGAEFGATTGRPRNCGWFDAVAARFSANIARINKIALTKLDRLSEFPIIKVATSYRHDGNIMSTFPADRFVMDEIEPVYIDMPGWKSDISDARKMSDLPIVAKDYIMFLQDLMGRHIGYVSVGPKAEQTIEIEPIKFI